MHYDIPNKIISIIQMLYRDFRKKVICDTELADSFLIQTGVLSPGRWQKPSYRLDTSQTGCLCRIPKLFWWNKISNEDLYRRTQTAAISDQMKEKKQTKWIGHFLRKDTSEIQRVALRCIPPGKRNRGRQKKTWWTSVDKEMIDQGWIRA